MDPLTLAALIGGGASIIGSGINFLGNKSSISAATADSEEARNFSRMMYDTQMGHTLGWKTAYKTLGHDGIGVDELGRARDTRDSGIRQRQAFDIAIDEYGMTPQEISGSPVPGGTAVSGGGASLGNNVAQATATRAAMSDRAADRAAQMKIASQNNQTELLKTAMQTGTNVLGQQVQADTQMSVAELQTASQQAVAEIGSETNIITSKMQSDASITASKIAASAANYTADVQRLNALGALRLQEKIGDGQIAQMAAQTGLLMQDKAIKAALHDERWERLFSTMGAENVVASALAVQNGIDIEGVLKGKVPVDMIPDLKAFTNEVLGRQSVLNRQFEGIMSIFGKGKETVQDAYVPPSLGQPR